MPPTISQTRRQRGVTVNQPAIAKAMADAAPPLVVLIESDVDIRGDIHHLLTDWGLRVIEADLESALPVRDEHMEAAAIIADYELGGTPERPQPFTGLDVALLIARRAVRRIPTLVISDNFGRQAIPACSPHRFPVMFKPISAEHLHGWLISASLPIDRTGGHPAAIAESAPRSLAAGSSRSAA